MFLDACDRLGMLVTDESFDMWQQAKNPDDYHLDFKDWWRVDLDAMVLRNRNHPSVIMWSIGNEISERSDPDEVSIARDLSSRVRALDTSRPITMAVPFFFDASKPRFSRSGEALPRLLPLVFINAAVNMAFWMRVVAREVRAFDGLRPFTHFRAATRFRLSHAVLGVSVRRPVRKNILVSLRRYPYEQT